MKINGRSPHLFIGGFQFLVTPFRAPLVKVSLNTTAVSGFCRMSCACSLGILSQKSNHVAIGPSIDDENWR